VDELGVGLAAGGPDWGLVLGGQDGVDVVGGGDILESLRRVFRHEYEVRRPHQVLWDRAWERFNNRWDFYRKREWQSKRGLPTFTVLALKYAWEMTKALELAGKNWFEVTTPLHPWRDLVDIPRDFVMEYLRPAGDDDGSDFFTVYYDAMVGMAISEMSHVLVVAENEGVVDYSPDESDIFGDLGESGVGDAVVPSFGMGESSQETGPPPVVVAQDKFRLRFEALNPRKVLVDTTSGRGDQYKVWYQEMTPWQFRRVASEFGWENVEEVIRAQRAGSGAEGSGSHEIRNRDARERGEASSPKPVDTIEIRHFFGTLFDERGEALFENKYCAWSGDFLLTPEPRDNPYWHGKIPIVSAGMIRVPWSNYHRSLLTLNLDSQEARTELLNLLLDYLVQVINPPTEVDWDQIASQKTGQFKSGIYPGMVIHTNKGPKNFPAVSRAATPDIPSGVWQGLGFFKTEFSEGAALADTGAMPRTRNRISAKEFTERRVASSGLWQQIMRNIERNLITPVLHQAYLLLLQKCPRDLWENFIDEKIASKLEGWVGQEEPDVVKKLRVMRNWGARERYEKLSAVFRFKVKVYSARESRRENLENISMITDMAQQIPGFAQRVKWHQVAKTAMISLEEDPDQFLWPDAGPTADRPMELPGGAAGDGGIGEPGVVSPVAPVPPGQG